MSELTWSQQRCRLLLHLGRDRRRVESTAKTFHGATREVLQLDQKSIESFSRIIDRLIDQAEIACGKPKPPPPRPLIEVMLEQQARSSTSNRPSSTTHECHFHAYEPLSPRSNPLRHSVPRSNPRRPPRLTPRFPQDTRGFPTRPPVPVQPDHIRCNFNPDVLYGEVMTANIAPAAWGGADDATRDCWSVWNTTGRAAAVHKDAEAPKKPKITHIEMNAWRKAFGKSSGSPRKMAG